LLNGSDFEKGLVLALDDENNQEKKERDSFMTKPCEQPVLDIVQD